MINFVNLSTKIFGKSRLRRKTSTILKSTTAPQKLASGLISAISGTAIRNGLANTLQHHEVEGTRVLDHVRNTVKYMAEY